MCRALVALLTATACPVRQYLATAASKAGTAGPCVSQSLRSTETTAAMSASLMDCRP